MAEGEGPAWKRPGQARVRPRRVDARRGADPVVVVADVREDVGQVRGAVVVQRHADVGGARRVGRGRARIRVDHQVVGADDHDAQGAIPDGSPRRRHAHDSHCQPDGRATTDHG